MILDPAFGYLLATMNGQSVSPPLDPNTFGDWNDVQHVLDRNAHGQLGSFGRSPHSLDERQANNLDLDTSAMEIDFDREMGHYLSTNSISSHPGLSNHFGEMGLTNPNHDHCTFPYQAQSGGNTLNGSSWAASAFNDQDGYLQRLTPQLPDINHPDSELHPLSFHQNSTATSFVGMRSHCAVGQSVHQLGQLFPAGWQASHIDSGFQLEAPPLPSYDAAYNSFEHNDPSTQFSNPTQLPVPFQIPTHEQYLDPGFQQSDISRLAGAAIRVWPDNGALHWDEGTLLKLLNVDQQTPEKNDPYSPATSCVGTGGSVNPHGGTELPQNIKFSQAQVAGEGTSSWGNPVEPQRAHCRSSGQRSAHHQEDACVPAPARFTGRRDAVPAQPFPTYPQYQDPSALAVPAAIQHDEGPNQQMTQQASNHAAPAPSSSVFTSKEAHRKLVEDVHDLGDGFLQSTFVPAIAESTGRGTRFTLSGPIDRYIVNSPLKSLNEELANAEIGKMSLGRQDIGE
ncbi:hypothetical protein CVT26_008425 [Gymnopilus dilepis]|uniref:Uncharacterized protein n=1 Tax=Gymnopilus dilepis TaxID=231916 RepID=A0A409YFV8_9AGAR|nr:hypothetical protein CVT26_008425 [Gymnopilus dilepis]